MNNLPETKADPRDIMSWGLANSLKQKFDFENDYLNKKEMPNPKTIPFGSTYNVTNNSGIGKLGQAALLAGVLGASGLGAYGLGLIPGKATNIPEIEPKIINNDENGQNGPQIVEGWLDWEFTPDDGFSTK